MVDDSSKSIDIYDIANSKGHYDIDHHKHDVLHRPGDSVIGLSPGRS